MNYPYFKVSASEETKEIFNNFYNQNKGVFGSKANMFRVMVSNLPVLASPSNNKFNDPESIKFEQKISELESMISNEVIEKLDDIDQKLSYFLKNKYKTEEKKDV
ncbi:hypothetical protein ACQ63C_000144 [Enterococcus hirae]|mgnify:FL=1|uniref:Uncharacterized protein n=2 Tax=Enterococcus TaxID=1350 RepID=A0ABD5FNH2_ENTCA|nr:MULTISPECIES: hypothetical protein [Enterococcus]EGP4891567.1 hypothetical protein [Enterococcus faecium]EGP5188417.1 hypothetical protein [Enterococcus faecium]EGP5575336.1 hypothetical protein [Enterococcus faecium]EME3574827.1 hypothetical protein [Enterococcus faecium]EME8073664.1 hypothetical protein [Enterococcus faecium]